MLFQWLAFTDFTTDSLYALLRFRQDVFIVEQNSAYPDLDGLDPFCHHLVVTDERGRLAGCLRARGAVDGAAAFIGRIVIGHTRRGTGLGRRLVQAGLDFIDQTYPGQMVEIGAQQHLLNFYSEFGFIATGAPYDDGGIPHLTMRRPAPPSWLKFSATHALLSI